MKSEIAGEYEEDEERSRAWGWSVLNRGLATILFQLPAGYTWILAFEYIFLE
jgi:hypothetical protein